jgi:integrase
MSIDQARVKAAFLNNQIAQGINIFDVATNMKQEMTLEELFTQYLERHADKTRKTSDDMRKNFKNWVGKLAKRKVSSLTRAEAEKLHGQLGKERGEYAANRAVQLLRAVYNKGIKWNLYDGINPFSGISLFEEKSRERFLDKQETTKLLKALESHPNNTLRDFIKLSLFTGVRKTNLMELEWANVDLEKGIMVIPDTKNGTKQVIALGGHEIVLLSARRDWLEEEDILGKFVFPGDGAKGHMCDIKKAWQTFREKINLKDVTIHDLRRSLGASMANANVNIALVKAALHHKDMKTTLNVYARTQQDAVKDARESVHLTWLQAAGLVETKDNVLPIEKKRKSSKKSRKKRR